MGRDRERQFEIEDTSTRSAKHQSGARASINIPAGLSMFRPKKQGSHNLDVIPYLVTESMLKFPENMRFAKVGRWYNERTFFVHANIGINNESYTCSAKTMGRKCYICEKRAELNMSPRQEDGEVAAKLKPKDRQMFLIYDRDDTEKGVQLWEVAHWNFGRHIDQYIDGARKSKIEAYRRYFHPTEGFTLRINCVEVNIGGKGGSKGGTNIEYKVHEFYDRESPVPDKLFDHGYDLDAMVRVLDYPSLKDIFNGVEPDAEAAGGDDGDGDGERYRGDDERPATSRTARLQTVDDDDDPPAAKTRKPEPEDDPPPVAAKGGIAVGDQVTFEDKGKTYNGEVTWINPDERIAKVKVPEVDRPKVMDLAELTKLTTTKAKTKKNDWGDPEDDFEPRPKKKPEPEDDEPPPKAKKKPADEDDEPPAKTKKRGGK